MGRDHSFSIFDADDSRKAITALLKTRSHTDPGPTAEAIRRFKHSHAPEAPAWLGEIYEHYEGALRAANAVDFDDLIRLAVQILEAHPSARRAHHRALSTPPRG